MTFFYIMTVRPDSPDNWWKSSLMTVALCIMMTALLLAAGCAGQSSDGKNVTNIAVPSLTTTIPSLHGIQAKPSPALMYPTGSGTKSPVFYELVMPGDDRFHDFLNDWNKKMSWGFSQQDIDSRFELLKLGVLAKYQFWDNSTLYIEDIHEFCIDLGNAMGLSPKKPNNSLLQQTRIIFRQGWVPRNNCYGMP
jgi:hypothetical protein